jgi:SLT domain-containing protein
MLKKNPVAMVGKVFGGMPEALRTLFTKNLLGEITSLPGKALSALGNLAGSITGAAKGIFGKVFGFVSGGGGGGVGRWLPTVLSVLNALHQPASLAGAVLRRIQFESGGNPNAINLTDINAQQGHPSQGLVQTIPGTFFAYAGPYAGRGITDPFANIYAGMNYALHRYGSIAAIDPLVRPRGYDSGGWLPPGLTMAVNGTGRPERIRTARQEDGLLAELRGLRRDLANLPVAQVDERYVRRTQRYMNGRDPNGW